MATRNAAIALLIMAGTACTAAMAAAQTLDPVTFQANWLIQGENAYMIAGKEKGFFEEEGIDLTINRGFGSGDTVKKVVSGTATVGTADIGVVMLAQVREDLPIQCIHAEYTFHPLSIWVRDDSDIKDFKDFEGKRLAVSAGSSMTVYFPLVAEANDLDPESVTWVTMEASAMLPTLLAGQIDGMPGFSTVFELRNEQTKEQGAAIRAFPFAENGLEVYGECQFTTKSTIENDPDLLERYVRAVHKSLTFARDNPDEVAELFVTRFPEMDADAIKLNHMAYMDVVFNETSAASGVGNFDTERLQITFDAVKASQGLDIAPDVDSFVDRRFLPEE